VFRAAARRVLLAQAGSDSYNRYEKYKKAKTPNEAIRLGALKGDIKNDFQKGFVKRA